MPRRSSACSGASTPEVAEIARALRLTVLEAMPGAIEWFDPGNGLAAIGTKRSMRDLLFAIILHRAHVNLQLADGMDLREPDRADRGNGQASAPHQGAFGRRRSFTVAAGRGRRPGRLSRSWLRVDPRRPEGRRPGPSSLAGVTRGSPLGRTRDRRSGAGSMARSLGPVARGRHVAPATTGRSGTRQKIHSQVSLAQI